MDDAPITLDGRDVGCRPTLNSIAHRLARLEELFELVPILLAGAGVDPTHVSIDVAARLLKVSVPTIRRKIRLGQLPLHVIAGTKVSGIPMTAVYEQWIPIRVARAALMRERTAALRASTARSSERKVRG